MRAFLGGFSQREVIFLTNFVFYLVATPLRLYTMVWLDFLKLKCPSRF
jgi:hypothetical protein